MMAACVCQVCDKPYSLNLKECGGLCDECKEKLKRVEQDDRTMTTDEVMQSVANSADFVQNTAIDPESTPDSDKVDVSDTLAEFWELSREGKEEWWPNVEWIKDEQIWVYVLKFGNPTRFEEKYAIVKLDALYIVKGHAETWLRGRGWGRVNEQLGLLDHWAIREGLSYAFSLPDAIRAEIGRGE